MKNRERFLVNRAFYFIPEKQTLYSLQTREEISLTRVVSDMLYFLCKKDGGIITYDELMCFVWGKNYRQISYNSVYQAVLVLRKNIQKVGCSDNIVKTIRKKGILLDCDVNETGIAQPDKPVGKSAVFLQKLQELVQKIILCRMIYLFLFSVSVVVFCAWYFYTGSLGVFDTYSAEQMLGSDCLARYDPYSYDPEQHRQFINKHAAVCLPGTVLYVTTRLSSRNISAVRCRKRYPRDRGGGNCTTLYFSAEKEQ